MSANYHSFLIPKAPLLSWKFLTHRSGCVRFPGLSRTARRYLFFWARNAIYHCLKALDIAPGDRILMPAYICAAAVEPIVAYGAEVFFYDVRRDCLSDLSEIEAKIDARTRAVMLVHYFGFPQPVRQFRDLCDRHGLWLIEDCAHVLQGEVEGQPLGSFGDASAFSWRKFLPLYDGGELILNRWRRELKVDWLHESPLFTLKVAKNLVDPLMEDTRHPLLQIPQRGVEASKDFLLRVANVSRRPAQPLATYSTSASFDPKMVNFPMSRLSRMILAHSDVPRIAAKRRRNYFYLQQALSQVEGLRFLFPELPAGVCPWVFPLFFEHFPNAHLPLRKSGIPGVTWGGVKHPTISRASFPEADFLYENLIFLPIHQDLDEKDLDLIVAAVRLLRQKARGGISATQL